MSLILISNNYDMNDQCEPSFLPVCGSNRQRSIDDQKSARVGSVGSLQYTQVESRYQSMGLGV